MGRAVGRAGGCVRARPSLVGRCLSSVVFLLPPFDVAYFLTEPVDITAKVPYLSRQVLILSDELTQKLL